MTETDLGTTASGLDANVAATLAYSLGWVTGLAFLFFEEENKFVRFHAWQSVIVFGSRRTRVYGSSCPAWGIWRSKGSNKWHVASGKWQRPPNNAAPDRIDRRP
jgi:hypothetical protein